MREESNLKDRRAITEERKTQKVFIRRSSFEERELSFLIVDIFVEMFGVTIRTRKRRIPF